MPRSPLRGWLARHPRTTAALFTMVLFLAQANMVAAEAGTMSQANPGSP